MLFNKLLENYILQNLYKSLILLLYLTDLINLSLNAIKQNI